MPESDEKFLRFYRQKELEELVERCPSAFILLDFVAKKARQVDEFSALGLEAGEALLGNLKEIGLTRQMYRTAVKKLVDFGFLAIRVTNRGTIAKLVGNRVFDFRGDGCANHQLTIKQPSTNHQLTIRKSKQLEINELASEKESQRKKRERNEEEESEKEKERTKEKERVKEEEVKKEKLKEKIYAPCARTHTHGSADMHAQEHAQAQASTGVHKHPSAKDALTFNFHTERFEGIEEKDLEKWRVAYPGIDLHQNIAACEEWIKANPNKTRNRKAWRKSITNWMRIASEKSLVFGMQPSLSGYRKAIDRRQRNEDGTLIEVPDSW